MADLALPAERSEGDQTVEIELEPVLALEEAQDSDESPPDYTTILGEAAPPPPLGYEEALAADTFPPHSKKTLTAEAPPSYRQLFGKGEEPDGQGHTHFRHRRRHTIRRREGQRSTTWWRRCMDKIPKDAKTTAKIILISAVLIVGVSLILSMIIVGFLNYDKCAAPKIPLYLIITGFILLADTLLHVLLFIGQKCSEDEAIFHLLRRCDCCAFFLFVWLLVGSTWMFQANRDQEVCRQAIDDVVIANSSGFMIHVSTDGTGTWGSDPTDCENPDCSSGVYVFAAVLILVQYVVAVALVLCCCSSAIKSRRS